MDYTRASLVIGLMVICTALGNAIGCGSVGRLDLATGFGMIAIGEIFWVVNDARALKSGKPKSTHNRIWVLGMVLGACGVVIILGGSVTR